MVQIAQIRCKDMRQFLNDYLDGVVPTELRALMESHLTECKHCTAIFDGTRNVLKLIVGGQAFEVPDDLSGKLYSRFDEYVKRYL